jgi:DNA-nicking Smr family endonuclease
VTLDWKYNPNHHILNVDDYEKNKKSRSKVELVMPKSIREDILREYCEVSRSQMTAVAKEINITKRNRRATALSTDAQEKRTEMLQSFSRKVKRTLSFSKKKEEHMLWENARTTSGMRVHSMNDLYTTGLQTSNSISFERKGTTDSTKKELRRGSSSTELSLGWERESISSAKVTLPVDSNDDDGWGFGYDIEE